MWALSKRVVIGVVFALAVLCCMGVGKQEVLGFRNIPELIDSTVRLFRVGDRLVFQPDNEPEGNVATFNLLQHRIRNDDSFGPVSQWNQDRKIWWEEVNLRLQHAVHAEHSFWFACFRREPDLAVVSKFYRRGMTRVDTGDAEKRRPSNSKFSVDSGNADPWAIVSHESSGSGGGLAFRVDSSDDGTGSRDSTKYHGDQGQHGSPPSYARLLFSSSCSPKLDQAVMVILAGFAALCFFFCALLLWGGVVLDWKRYGGLIAVLFAIGIGCANLGNL